MENLIEAFATSEVTPQLNSTARDHPHFSLYKAKPSGASQEERRRKYLAAQKVKRDDQVDYLRGLATSVFVKEKKTEETSEEMEYEELYVKPPRSFKDQLMLSEWLVEVPSDLESQWFLVLCPVGKRCLVVSAKGITKVYTKSGYMISSFQSRLPGGGPPVAGAPQHVYTILDCIYNQVEKTYYILDVMCWNSHPCLDSDTEFRFYWVQSKLEECPEVKVISKYNAYKFLPLPHFSCDKESIRRAAWSPLPFAPKLDGLLFYHKRTAYYNMTTPLVGWLKGYMLPEMLGIDVPNELLAEKPASYVTMRQHLPEAFLKNEQRKQADERNMQYEEE